MNLPFLQPVWNYLYCLVIWYFRPVIKWVLRRTTKLCELQRICYGEPVGAMRTSKIEESLNLSRVEDIVNLISYLNKTSQDGKFKGENEEKVIQYAVLTVTRVKGISKTSHRAFYKAFGQGVEQIWGYKQLCTDIERLRSLPYNSDDTLHENMLLGLWESLMPDKKLESRISKSWSDIGFQGDDPKTDFRGMGILGLENLFFFANEYNEVARQVLSHSHHPTYGYSFAIVGINLTHMAYRFLKSGLLKCHMANVTPGCPGLVHFYHFYAYLFHQFDKYWIEARPKDIMEFSRIRDQFENNMSKSLSAYSVLCTIDSKLELV